jgi:hypothetical protein
MIMMELNYEKEYTIPEVFEFPEGTKIILLMNHETYEVKYDSGLKCLRHISANVELALNEKTVNSKCKLLESATDWTQIEVDTKILVSNDKTIWERRYFAKYECGKVHAWSKGVTSFSKECEDDMFNWNYAKLYNEND